MAKTRRVGNGGASAAAAGGGGGSMSEDIDTAVAHRRWLCASFILNVIIAALLVDALATRHSSDDVMQQLQTTLHQHVAAKVHCRRVHNAGACTYSIE